MRNERELAYSSGREGENKNGTAKETDGELGAMKVFFSIVIVTVINTSSF